MVGNRYGIPARPSTMMKGMRGPVRLTGVALTTLAVVLSSGSSAVAGVHGAPVNSPAPAVAPTSSHANGSCSTPGVSTPPPSTESQHLMWVDPKPTTLTAVWLPGLNAKHCAARRTVSGAALARRVAGAIEHAKAFPTGALPCPFDDNTSVRLYFGYRTGGDEYADVALSGCRPISAPGRRSRWNDDQVEHALLPAAPPAWRVSLGAASSDALGASEPARHGKPVIETAPDSSPLTARRNGACTTELNPPPTPPHPGHRLLWVNRTPNRVVAIWVPGANASRCVAQRTVDNATLARPIAHAIRRAPAFPRGVFCPLDDGAAVRLYLTYPNGQNEYVNVELSGCHALTSPGRSGRKMTTALTRLLRKAAPPAWLPYLAG